MAPHGSQRAHMKSSVDEVIFGRDMDFSQEKDDGFASSLARPHQKTNTWTTSTGVFHLPAGENRRPYLGHATTPAPIYGRRTTAPPTRPVPLYLSDCQYAGPRSAYCAGARPRPKTAPPSRTLPHYMTTNQACFVRPPPKECAETTQQAAALRRRLTERMNGADVFMVAQNAARDARLRRPASRERIPRSGQKITWSGDPRFLTDPAHEREAQGRGG